MTKPFLNLVTDNILSKEFNVGSIRTEPFTEEEVKYINDTVDHVKKVQSNLEVISHKLIERGMVHDVSKLREPEMSGYIQFGKDLKTLQYGTDEYKEAINTNPAVKHHWSVNSHHPEYYENGIKDMSILDIIEMVADWKAACERTKNGNFKESLEINKKRFNISDELYSQITKLCQEAGWI